ncbi:MAG: hypothetical protein RL346_336 [Verrucomicrobiota bacterium]|jgi:hypothetical protein
MWNYIDPQVKDCKKAVELVKAGTEKRMLNGIKGYQNQTNQTADQNDRR